MVIARPCALVISTPVTVVSGLTAAARLHTVGAKSAFRTRPALDRASFGTEPRDRLLAHDAIALEEQLEAMAEPPLVA